MRYHLAILAYCLMPNHVHFIVVPKKEDSIGKAFKYINMRYSQYYNKKIHTTGHLFQGRFFSSVMDEMYTLACARYIERNPVRAKMIKKPYLYDFSSARIHCCIDRIDELGVNRLFKYIEEKQGSWKEFVEMSDNDSNIRQIKQSTKSGRPLGTGSFVEKLEKKLSRTLKLKPRGRPKRKEKGDK